MPCLTLRVKTNQAVGTTGSTLPADKTSGIDSTGCITNNRFIDCTDIAGTIYHNNMVNGVWTA